MNYKYNVYMCKIKMEMIFCQAYMYAIVNTFSAIRIQEDS